MIRKFHHLLKYTFNQNGTFIGLEDPESHIKPLVSIQMWIDQGLEPS